MRVYCVGPDRSARKHAAVIAPKAEGAGLIWRHRATCWPEPDPAVAVSDSTLRTSTSQVRRLDFPLTWQPRHMQCDHGRDMERPARRPSRAPGDPSTALELAMLAVSRLSRCFQRWPSRCMRIACLPEYRTVHDDRPALPSATSRPLARRKTRQNLL